MAGTGLAPFFHLEGVELTDQPCQGTACFLARHRNPTRWAAAVAEPRVYCLGRCYAAPAAASDRSDPPVAVDAATPILLGRIVSGSTDADRYLGLVQARRRGPAEVLDEVERSGLRGRGGAAFPTWRKLRAVASSDADVKYVVVNADEGDPGAFGDRVLLESDPHEVLDGLAIAAHAVGARHGIIYVRKEYPDARRRIEAAVVEAADALAPLTVQVVSGEGSYVCGEETALLEALEGRRPTVRVRPPFPTERGLFGRPTVICNVETLAALPWIVANGGEAYAAMGTPSSPGTKLVSLSSQFARPGLYEVELGIPVREIVERLGGGTDGDLRGVLVGGPLVGILPAHLLDTALDIDAMRAVGCDVGHGGVVAVDDRTSIVDLARHVFRFGAYESCGTCTPCRLGVARVEGLLAAGDPSGREELERVVATLAATSLCGHGTGLAAFARSVLTHFGEELLT